MSKFVRICFLSGAALALVAVCVTPWRGQSAVPVPDETLTSIQESIQAGKLPEAFRAVSQALAAHPNDAGLLNLRGVIHAQRKELTEARKDFASAVGFAPGLTPAWQNLARACQLSLGPIAEDSHCAVQAWQRVLDLRPGDPEARFSLAALYEQQKKYADSLREIEKLPADAAARSEALALRCADLAALGRLQKANETARRLTEAGDFSEADIAPILPALAGPSRAALVITLVEALEARGAASLESRRQLVVAYEQVNRLSDARKTLERLAIEEPKDPRHLFELARVAYLEHDLNGALGYLGHARDLVPGDPQVHFLFGMILVELKLPLDARKSLEKAVALDPHNPDYDYALGAIILSSRDASNAIPCFRKYVDAKPRDARGHFALGVAYFAAGDYEKCRSEMQGILKNPETEAGAAYFLGRVARIDQNYDEAATFLDRSIRLLPSFGEAYAELAGVRLRQGRLDEAKTAIHHALSLDPDSFHANSTLLAMYQRTHDPRADQQAARLRKLDRERGKEHELMLRHIEVRPY
ncbi:MAG TPA: tetratricopeptide repeat protein [Bryobacteraceae bacterium]|nr:tetratricopeptide repeat protein [Bryobacteraceae bacterium]